MKHLLTGMVVVACATLGAFAGEGPDSALERALLELIHGPAAGQETREVEGRRTTLAFDAMTYQVHVPNRSGWMQPAFGQTGPRAGGGVVEIDALEGAYGGPMELPQVFPGPYYATHCNEVVEAGRHYLVRARFGHAFAKTARREILARIGMAAFAERDPARPEVPVSVTVEPCSTSYVVGTPLLVDVTLRNDLRAPVRFQTFAKTPNGWNGETAGVELPEVRRDGMTRSLFLARPPVEVPPTVSGIGSFEVAPGETLRLRVDLAKWKIEKGWGAGEYECVLRLDGIRVDALRTLSVRSSPFRLTVRYP